MPINYRKSKSEHLYQCLQILMKYTSLRRVKNRGIFIFFKPFQLTPYLKTTSEYVNQKVQLIHLGFMPRLSSRTTVYKPFHSL